jgi:hypothetical protein
MSFESLAREKVKKGAGRKRKLFPRTQTHAIGVQPIGKISEGERHAFATGWVAGRKGTQNRLGKENFETPSERKTCGLEKL